METVVERHTDEDLQLLLRWKRDDDPGRSRNAAAISLLVHALLIGGLAVIPGSQVDAPRPVARTRRILTPLFDPPTELTQKAPTKGKITKEITAEMIPDRPRIQAPAPAAKRGMPAPPAPPPQMAKAAPPAPMPEPPKVAQSPPQPSTQIAQLATPQIQPPPADKPKLAFEIPGAPASSGPKGLAPRLAVPAPSIQEAVRSVARGNSGAGLSGGDSEMAPVPPGLNLPASAGRPRVDFQLQSDPMGVDFKPYIQQVLQTVRRNWFAVYPESAKLGQRGMVNLTFSIEPGGTIPKAIVSSSSGVRALDQAAVAALSASNPLSPLPAEFHGTRIILRFTFSYNIPVH
ncbi:MAG: TonB family protein [Acidobacteriota bacterium]|nr:TonB family protein [Acidobacteriota bacterium]